MAGSLLDGLLATALYDISIPLLPSSTLAPPLAAARVAPTPTTSTPAEPFPFSNEGHAQAIYVGSPSAPTNPAPRIANALDDPLLPSLISASQYFPQHAFPGFADGVYAIAHGDHTSPVRAN